MKKLSLFLILTLIVFCLAGCTGKNEKTVNSSDVPKNTVSSEKSELPPFKTGLWGVNDNGTASGLYYFSDSKSECSYHDINGEGGMPFDYEITDGKYIFHMGGAEDNSEVDVSFSDEDHATLLWNDGTKQQIVYVINLTYDEYNSRDGKGDIIFE